jgi:steroid delta-isomerase-like uncharacterized protein
VEAAPEGGELGRAYRRFLDEGWNKDDAELLSDMVAVDYLGHDPLGEIQGRSGLAGFYRAFREAFPDHVIAVQDEIIADGRTAHRWVAEGTHDGEFLGIQPTGRRINLSGMTISRWHEGTIAEAWYAYDLWGLIHSLEGGGADCDA